MPLELPSAPFDEIAVDLMLYANSAASAASAGEIMAARGAWAGGFRHTLAELRRSAEIAGSLYAFFRAAGEHEEQIRDFLAGLSSLAGAAEIDRKKGAA